MDTQKRQDFRLICRQHGWKCTPQRAAVYAYVSGSLSHPGVDAVWGQVQESLPMVTRESVYRILNELASAGVIQRLDHVERARYDSQTGPHGHFICERCQEITDFSLPAGVDLPRVAVAGTVRHVEFRLSGVCEKCSHQAQGE